MEELHDEGDRMIGDDIAEQGIRQLLAINGAGGEAAIYAMGNTQAAE